MLVEHRKFVPTFVTPLRVDDELFTMLMSRKSVEKKNTIKR